MSNQLFILCNDEDGIFAIYDDLNAAKQKMINLSHITCDFKHYGYQICVYDKIDSEYVLSKVRYTHWFNKGDTFIMHTLE